MQPYEVERFFEEILRNSDYLTPEQRSLVALDVRLAVAKLTHVPDDERRTLTEPQRQEVLRNLRRSVVISSDLTIDIDELRKAVEEDKEVLYWLFRGHYLHLKAVETASFVVELRKYDRLGDYSSSLRRIQRVNKV